MGLSGRRVLVGGSRAWARVVLLAALAGSASGACSGSTTRTHDDAVGGGDPAGDFPDVPTTTAGRDGVGHTAGDGFGGFGSTGDSGGTTGFGGFGGTGGRGGFGGTGGRGGFGGTGGTGGTGGRGGFGGTAGRGGSGAGGATPVGGVTRLGRACVNDAECATATEKGLLCITETSDVLGNGAPPKGLCTRPCATDDDCTAHGAGALCYPFVDGDDSHSYCVEGCQFGTPDPGDPKCHSRLEFACSPALFGSTGDPCQSSQSCSDGEICVGGTCNVVSSGCLPACRGDIDCGAGRYCDQSFLSGVCTTRKPIGKRLGEPCSVAAPSQTTEPDECLGFCQADTAGGTKGHCAASCAFGRECGWDSEAQRYDGLCVFGSVLTATDIAEGDFGFCGLTCNCSNQCNDATLECQLLAGTALSVDTFKGAGLCFESGTGATPLEACGAGGANDAGGAAGAP